MPYLKGNLHIHTNLSDGALAPKEMREIYRNLEYDFIAFTDHDFLIKPPYWERLPDGDEHLIVFKGIELEYPPLNYQHIGKILGDQETLFIFNHPNLYRLSIPELKQQIALVAQDMPIHCLEVTDKGIYTPMYDSPEILLPKIATDDAHTSDQCGWAWIEVESAKGRDAILQAIKKGNCRIGLK